MSNIVTVGEMDNERRVSCAHFATLPFELIIEIANYACSFSQSTYRSILLVSRIFHALVKLGCLHSVPVVLNSAESALSFLNFIQSSPKIPLYVQYLWITNNKDQGNLIVEECTNVIKLACTFPNLYHLTSLPQFRHNHCKELAITQVHWYTWKDLPQDSIHCTALYRQLTHLRLPYPFSLRLLPREYLTSLTHIAFWPRESRAGIALDLADLGDLRSSLHLIVVTTNGRRNLMPYLDTLERLGVMDKFSMLQCERDWDELDDWRIGVGGGHCIWDSPIGCFQ